VGRRLDPVFVDLSRCPVGPVPLTCRLAAGGVGKPRSRDIDSLALGPHASLGAGSRFDAIRSSRVADASMITYHFFIYFYTVS
jgi:hypothetical protein